MGASDRKLFVLLLHPKGAANSNDLARQLRYRGMPRATHRWCPVTSSVVGVSIGLVVGDFVVGLVGLLEGLLVEVVGGAL